MLLRIFGTYLFIIGRKGVENMARTYESVPASLKPQVKEMLIDLELESLITE